MKKIVKSFLLIVIINSIFCFSGYCEDPDFSSKVLFRKVTLDDSVAKTLGLKTETVLEKEVSEIIKTPGQIEEIPENHFDVNSPVQGVVLSVNVDLGDIVKKGQSLVNVRSTEIAKLQAEIEQFQSELELTKKNYERDKLLFEKRISPKKDLDISESLLITTEAKLNAAKNNLNILTGISSDSNGGLFSIRSLKTGTVVERNISVGQVVNQNQILFRGVDLSTVWVNADIFEKDLANIALGQRVSVILDGDPSKAFEGHITYIGSIINKDTRTLPVKATLKNTDGSLKPGAFAKLTINTGVKRKKIIIPQLALTETDNEGIKGNHEHIVYLKENNSFIPKKIQVEKHDSDSVSVISGLMNGDIIVTQGSYQLQYGQNFEKEEESFQIPWKFVISTLILFIIFMFFKIKKSKSS